MKIYKIFLSVLFSAVAPGGYGHEHAITDIETNTAVMEKINIGKKLDAISNACNGGGGRSQQ